MDVEEIRRLVFRRLQVLEPEQALKVMGYLLLHDCDLHTLALSPDSLLHSLIASAKHHLRLPSSQPTPPLDPADSLSFLPSAASMATCSPHTHSSSNGGSSTITTIAMAASSQQQLRPIPYPHGTQKWSSSPLAAPPSPTSFDINADYYGGGGNNYVFFNHHVDDDGGPTVQGPRLFSSCAAAFSPQDIEQQMGMGYRACLFFSRGYCKHGSSCRFSHASGDGEKAVSNHLSSYASSFGVDVDAESSGSDDSAMAQHNLQSFEALEQELRELLRGKKSPVSIASLPQMYYDRFGKSLQAEGYLTESQRHGKTGFSLTKLLMRLRGTLRLIERPHGQHAVMLLEEEASSGGGGGGRDDMNASSRQIYLTFPAESSFTEEDVTIHFRAYGAVQDVRIPYQQKRMFGFVTFVDAETVRTILTEGNPHYICGARVLVKPYKEKGKVWKSQDRPDVSKHMIQPPVSSSSSYLGSKFGGQETNLLVMQEAATTVLEQGLSRLELDGIQAKARRDGSRRRSNMGGKDALELDWADHGCSMSSNHFKYVLDLLDCESQDYVETTPPTIVSPPGPTSQLDLVSLGRTRDHGSIEAAAHSSLHPKTRLSNHWSNQQNSQVSQQHGWGGATPTLFARSVF